MRFFIGLKFLQYERTKKMFQIKGEDFRVLEILKSIILLFKILKKKIKSFHSLQKTLSLGKREISPNVVLPLQRHSLIFLSDSYFRLANKA